VSTLTALGTTSEKESSHPERSEGSPDAMEMSRKTRYDVLLWEEMTKRIQNIIIVKALVFAMIKNATKTVTGIPILIDFCYNVRQFYPHIQE
tara:strand:- start:184 stop:459 length:276 start_codon:yes stop_codon:yes gene_type:complete